jgi:hypothetical protein
MPMTACPVDCSCDSCQSARPAEYKKPEIHDWESDAREAGKLHMETQRSLWRTAFLIARNVAFDRKPGRPKNDSEESYRVSQRAFADEAGISQSTVCRYLMAWQSAAQKGWVPLAATLTPNRDVKAIDSLTAEQWDEVKPKQKIARDPAQEARARAANSESARNARSPSSPASPTGTGATGVSIHPELVQGTSSVPSPTLDGVVIPPAPLLERILEAVESAKAVRDRMTGDYMEYAMTDPVMTALSELLQVNAAIKDRAAKAMKVTAASVHPKTKGDSPKGPRTDWLTQEFQEAERVYRALPEAARPVVVPPAPTLDERLTNPRPRSEIVCDECKRIVSDGFGHDARCSKAGTK